MNLLKAGLAGAATFALMTALWTYLSYDFLPLQSLDWFYRVNAVWHEHPETGLLVDPLFYLSLFLGNSLTFGLSAFVASWLSPGRPWRPSAIVIALGSAPAVSRALLLSFTNAPVEFKAALGIYLFSAWLLGLAFAWLATTLRSCPDLEE